MLIVVKNVNTAQATKVQFVDFSFIELFLNAGLIVKLVIILLFLGSIVSWAIIIDKLILFKKSAQISLIIETLLMKNYPIENIYREVSSGGKIITKHPFAAMLAAATGNLNGKDIKYTSKDEVWGNMKIAAGRSFENIGANINFLATIANNAPFIGLFGTVWGIMNSFKAIASVKSVALSVVAPGIAEALLATAIGLAVAIPSSIFYNKFTSDLNSMSDRAESFALKVITSISSED